MRLQAFIFIVALLLLGFSSVAQKGQLLVIKADSTPANLKKVKIKTHPFSRIDTAAAYNPKIAIVRSAILPGWGQITNKKYWKLPLVYGALGTTAVVFFHNIKQFRQAKNAYLNSIDGDTSNDKQIPQPYYNVKDQPERIRVFRNQVRQNVDYSVLIFVLFWGLNVADAAVDAHLKTFDVSDELSLQIKPGYSPMANTTGIGLVLDIHSKKTSR